MVEATFGRCRRWHSTPVALHASKAIAARVETTNWEKTKTKTCEGTLKKRNFAIANEARDTRRSSKHWHKIFVESTALHNELRRSVLTHLVFQPSSVERKTWERVALTEKLLQHSLLRQQHSVKILVVLAEILLNDTVVFEYFTADSSRRNPVVQQCLDWHPSNGNAAPDRSRCTALSSGAAKQSHFDVPLWDELSGKEVQTKSAVRG